MILYLCMYFTNTDYLLSWKKLAVMMLAQTVVFVVFTLGCCQFNGHL